MKKLLCVLAIMLFPVSLWAADATLKWDEVPGAIGYKIYMSGDGGRIWDTGTDVGMATQDPNIPSMRNYLYQNIPEDRLVLFKASAYDANIESIREWSGAWYDHRKKPLMTPGLGIQ